VPSGHANRLESVGGSGGRNLFLVELKSDRAVLLGSSTRDRSEVVRQIGGILVPKVKSMMLELSSRGPREQAVGDGCRPSLISPLPPFIGYFSHETNKENADLDEHGIIYRDVDYCTREVNDKRVAIVNVGSTGRVWTKFGVRSR